RSADSMKLPDPQITLRTGLAHVIERVSQTALAHAGDMRQLRNRHRLAGMRANEVFGPPDDVAAQCGNPARRLVRACSMAAPLEVGTKKGVGLRTGAATHC